MKNKVNKIEVSFIIANYNGLDLLKKFLPNNIRLIEKELSKDYEIIIADDNSTDSSEQFIESLSVSQLKFLKNKSDRGFGSNCNYAAKNSTGEYLFFLNNDIQLEKNFFKPLLKKLEEDKVFSVVPMIVRPHENNLVESLTSGCFGYRGLKLQIENIYNKNIKKSHKILWSCGGAFMCKRQIFLNLNGFDERYNPYYVEDVDLSMKAWRMGFENWYVGNSKVLHYHEYSTIRRFEKRRGTIKKIYKRNIYIFLIKHFMQTRKFYFIIIFLYHMFLVHLNEIVAIIKALKRYKKDNLNYIHHGEQIFDMLKKKHI